MRICILGNSIPLLVSPYRSCENDKTYGELLKNLGHEVVIHARQSSMISDLYKNLEEDCISFFPDCVVLNFGIVECTFRTKNRHIQAMLNENSWKNTIIRKSFTSKWKRYALYITKKMIKPIDVFLHKISLHYRWLSPHTFSFIVFDILRSILKDTGVKKILIIGMLDCPDWLEKTAKGTRESIKIYNNILQLSAAEIDHVEFIDPNSISSDSMRMTDDGIHFTADGHSLVYQEIMKKTQICCRIKYDDWKNINPNTRKIIIPTSE